jgi:hypothetical protein
MPSSSQGFQLGMQTIELFVQAIRYDAVPKSIFYKFVFLQNEALRKPLAHSSSSHFNHIS